MLTNPFGRKNSKVQRILKLGDQLSLSLRENVELIDSEDSKLTFITESGYVIEGDFDFDTNEFSNIKTTTTDLFEDQELFDNIVTKQISNVLESLLEDNRREASNKFNKILNLWESRSKFDRVIERLIERKERYNLYASIVESNQFEVMQEVKPLLIEMLKQAKENNSFTQYKGLINSVKLSNTISTAFDLPRLTIDDLNESTFQVTDRRFNSIYDIVCRQELIKKDLIENKKAFSSLWLNSSEVNSLVEFIGKNNNEALSETLSRIINSNPYFALATKKQLFELLENSISFSDIDSISNKEVKEFVAKIYEAKKPVKDLVIENLNKKYGINVQNLKTTPSFSELGKVQKTIFESLAKMAPRNSALRTALEDFVSVLGSHSGVDVIDINEWIVDVFMDANYTNIINETALLNYMNFDKVASDLTKIGQVLKMIQAGMGGEAMPEDGQYEADGAAGEDAMASMAGGEDQKMPDEISDDAAEEEGEMGDEEDPMPEEEGEDGDLPQESPEEAAMGAQEDMSGEMGQEEDEMGEEEGDDENEVDQDEFLGYLEDLEGLIDSLKSKMGEGGEEEMGDEEGPEEEMPEGDEEGDEEPEGEESPEEEMGEEDEEDDQEEEFPAKKKKPFPPKE